MLGELRKRVRRSTWKFASVRGDCHSVSHSAVAQWLTSYRSLDVNCQDPHATDETCPFTGCRDWSQLMAGCGGSQGLPSSALRMASSAVMPWAAAVSR